MGGLAPGIGGFELVMIALVALLVVGPKDLPLLMRKVGRALGKARAMANEFRASFDEMARQSELDELRKEVEALRTGQAVPLGAEADAAFKDIRDDLSRPLDMPSATAAPARVKATEVEAAQAGSETVEPDVGQSPPAAKPKSKPKTAGKPAAKPASKGSASKAAVKPRAPRSPARPKATTSRSRKPKAGS